MGHLRNLKEEGYNNLMELPVSSWSRHGFDENVKNDHVTNNLSESFKNWVGAQRNNTILNMLEWFRMQLMGMIQKRYEVACSWQTVVTPNIRKRLNQLIEESRQCSVIFAGADEYEIMDETGRTVVNLGARTCVCRAWQISGLPCKHAAAAMAYKRMNIELFYDEKFSKHAYLEAHGGMIHPIVDSKLWPPAHGDPLDPPPPYRRPGRPKKNRRIDADEPTAWTSQVRRSMTIRCMICKALGHNKRTYPKNTNKVQKGSSLKAANASGPKGSSSTSQVILLSGLI
ncbi:uncharacterized protein LOC132316326 [Cornus florida]|uniref:uncharacterized protein LOC132316326 n=1 Tax=Cornus florida TaxID=4283 RepID=UPI00289B88A9|nr:uncharacterized protein LOC132316326 [Cornus florida]